jgi:EmrB/QacA subfamily drug resistance transporter
MNATGTSLINNPSPALDANLLRTAAVVVLGSLMAILDTTIVNVAINHLSRRFDASLAIIQWVSAGYMLALATVIPLTGWAADRFGTKRIYIAAIAMFAAGSALCGTAWSAGSLIGFRIVQGFGGGMILPAGITILTHAAGPRRIGRAMAIIGVPMLLGPILGPILGGYLVDHYSWRWIFLVNLPVAVLAILAAVRTLETDVPKPHHRLDWKGLATLSPGLAIFVYGLAELASGRGVGAAKTVVGVGLGLALVFGFLLHAWPSEGALIDVRLFTRRAVGASAINNFLFGAVFFGMSLLVPLYVQIVRGQPAFQAGLLIAAQGIGAMITMPISGRLADKIGPGKVVLTGIALFAIGMVDLSRITGITPYGEIELTLFTTGLGVGATLMPTMSAALSTLKRDEVARTTSGLSVLLRVGGSVGTALAAVALTQQLSSLPSGGNEPFTLSAARTLPPAARTVMLQGLGEAFAHTFLWGFGILVLAFVAALFLPRHAVPVPAQDSTASGAEAPLQRGDARGGFR